MQDTFYFDLNIKPVSNNNLFCSTMGFGTFSYMSKFTFSLSIESTTIVSVFRVFRLYYDIYT